MSEYWSSGQCERIRTADIKSLEFGMTPLSIMLREANGLIIIMAKERNAIDRNG